MRKRQGCCRDVSWPQVCPTNTGWEALLFGIGPCWSLAEWNETGLSLFCWLVNVGFLCSAKNTYMLQMQVLINLLLGEGQTRKPAGQFPLALWCKWIVQVFWGMNVSKFVIVHMLEKIHVIRLTVTLIGVIMSCTLWSIQRWGSGQWVAWYVILVKTLIILGAI